MTGHFKLKAFLIVTLGLLSTLSPAAAPKADFNGDGRADALMRNLFTGELTAWLLNGTRILETASYGVVGPVTGWTPIASADVSGDGKSDLLWYNVINGGVAVWLVDGAHLSQAAVYGVVARESGWVPVAAEDFNNDSRTDLLWYNLTTGGLTVWLLNGTAIQQGVAVGTVPRQSGWAPIAAEDLNGDGHTDLLWHNAASGEIAAWILRAGGLVAGASFGSNAPQLGWIPATSSDFNGDGRADLLWYNTASGDLTVWLMDGARITAAVPLPAVNPATTGWTPMAAEDFNGDGRTDLLWTHAASGSISVWLLDSGRVLQGGGYGVVSPTSGWTLAGFDDYNGDGRTDLFWTNVFTSATTTWLTNGAAVAQSLSFGNMPPSSVWQAQIPR